MAEVVRTNFAHIFTGFENFLGHSGTTRSATWRRFSNLFYKLKGLSFPEETLQISCKSAYKCRLDLFLNNKTASPAPSLP